MSFNLPRASQEGDSYEIDAYQQLVLDHGQDVVEAAERILDEAPNLVEDVSEDRMHQLISAIGIVEQDPDTYLNTEA